MIEQRPGLNLDLSVYYGFMNLGETIYSIHQGSLEGYVKSRFSSPTLISRRNVEESFSSDIDNIIKQNGLLAKFTSNFLFLAFSLNMPYVSFTWDRLMNEVRPWSLQGYFIPRSSSSAVELVFLLPCIGSLGPLLYCTLYCLGPACTDLGSRELII